MRPVAPQFPKRSISPPPSSELAAIREKVTRLEAIELPALERRIGAKLEALGTQIGAAWKLAAVRQAGAVALAALATIGSIVGTRGEPRSAYDVAADECRALPAASPEQRACFTTLRERFVPPPSGAQLAAGPPR